MTNLTKSLSLQVKFNGTTVKSLSFSPLRDLYLDFDSPTNISIQKNSDANTDIIKLYNDEFFVCLPKFFNGSLLLNNNSKSFEEIKNNKLGKDFNNQFIIPIDKLDTLIIKNGNFEIKLSMSKNLNLPKGKNKSYDLIPYISTATVAALLMLLLFFSISPNANSLDLNSLETSNLFTNASIKPDQEKEKDLSNLKNDIKNDPGGKGKKHKFDEGKMGKKESKNQTGQYAIKGDVNNKNITLAREKALQTALDSSVIQYLNGGGKNGSPFQSVFADKANGNNPEDVLGGLYGNEIREAEGGYGLGLKGTGIGGGGDGEGTIGLGNDNTVGKGGGGGNNSGYGKGAGNLGGRKATAPDPMNGVAEIKGSLDKEIIRRVIRRNINQIKFCYDSELQKDPTLNGRVRIKFVIDQNGAVASSTPVGIGVSNVVDTCVANKIKQLSFPMPEGGGIVEVTYPFMFQSAGEQAK